MVIDTVTFIETNTDLVTDMAIETDMATMGTVDDMAKAMIILEDDMVAQEAADMEIVMGIDMGIGTAVVVVINNEYLQNIL